MNPLERKIDILSSLPSQFPTRSYLSPIFSIRFADNAALMQGSSLDQGCSQSHLHHLQCHLSIVALVVITVVAAAAVADLAVEVVDTAGTADTVAAGRIQQVLCAAYQDSEGRTESVSAGRRG